MRIRHGRMIIASSLLSAGLVTWSGCSTENPDGTPTKLGKMEEKVKEGAEKAGEKIKEGAHVAGEKIKEGAEKVKDAVTPEKKP